MSQNPDKSHEKYSEERLSEARIRVSDMIALADVLGVMITPEEISAAALVPIHPVGEFFAAVLANCAIRNAEGVARILAGLGDDRALAMFMGDEVDSTKMLPARRPRRPRPTAADRARLADEWLAGPAREIVDPDLNSFPTEGAP